MASQDEETEPVFRSHVTFGDVQNEVTGDVRWTRWKVSHVVLCGMHLQSLF